MSMVKRYYSGQTMTELSEVYYFSEKRIQGIIHEFALHDEKFFEKGIGQYLV
ncbi:MAG: hypothetical protein PUG54_02520 [Firmicutes bacterium]|nr:hypothetical protein [Bacillota bacterium]